MSVYSYVNSLTINNIWVHVHMLYYWQYSWYVNYYHYDNIWVTVHMLMI